MKRLLLWLSLFLCGPFLNGQQIQPPIVTDIVYLSELYQHFHEQPELSFEEEETSKRVAEELRLAGYEVTEQIGGYGVVGVLENGSGPIILIRADMDALPITEATGLPYASKKEGIMHACGHDIHMTVMIGAARQLSARKNEWSGTLVFIGQPAEERSGGAKAMLADGLFEKFPYPDYALALHCNSDLPAGKVGLCPGYAMANVDMLDITVYGEGGHGASPETTKDPVVLAARLIMAMQTIVSREIPPSEPAVLTVGSIHGGSKGNIIPDEVKLELTLRSYSDEVRNGLIERIQRVASGVAMSAGISEDRFPKVVVRDEYTPSLFNDRDLTASIQGAFEEAIGEENVVSVGPKMVGEDFGRFGRTEPSVPILQYWLGAVNLDLVEAAQSSGEKLPPLHSAQFAPLPGPTIKTGVQTMTVGVLHLLNQK
jgi:amidohydrolase